MQWPSLLAYIPLAPGSSSAAPKRPTAHRWLHILLRQSRLIHFVLLAIFIFFSGVLRQPRIVHSVLLAIAIFFSPVAYYLRNIKPFPASHKQAYLMLHTPPALHKLVRWWTPVEAGDLGPPRDIPELYNARWAGSWDLPGIRPLSTHPTSSVSEPSAPAGVWVALYIFSMPNPKCRARRNLIRNHHPLQTLPPHLRSLVSVKFVLGYFQPNSTESEDGKAWTEANEREEEAIREEQEEHGDIVRLDGLVNGENMNDGKSFEWAKWAGREGNEAQWIFKCDDDTYVILPNLLDILLTLDPSQPTYLGSSLGYWAGYHWYYTGQMYGFSWGVARTISTANAPKDWYTWHWDEDAFMGEVMYLLPPKPLCTPDHAHSPAKLPSRLSRIFGLLPSPPTSKTCLLSPMAWDTPPPGGWNSPPSSPDARTGLVRYDMEGKMGAQWDWWVAGPDRAVAWHPVKEDQQYLDAYHRAKDHFVDKHGRYEWHPPQGWEQRLVWAV